MLCDERELQLVIAVYYPFFDFRLGQEYTVAKEAKKLRMTNLLEILRDEQGCDDLQSYGHVFLKTANIDKLAEEGIEFTRW